MLYLQLIWASDWELIAIESAERIKGELENLSSQEKSEVKDDEVPLKE